MCSDISPQWLKKNQKRKSARQEDVQRESDEHNPSISVPWRLATDTREEQKEK